MIGYVVFFAMLAGAFYWIVRPLLQEGIGHTDFRPKPQDVLQVLKDKKDGAYAAIRELEFDLSLGKLDSEDFQTLKRQYAEKAVGYMIEMDKIKASQQTVSKAADEVTEDDVGEAVAVIDPPDSAARKHIFCTSCGERASVENRFCAACGSNLHKHRQDYRREEN